MSFDIFKDIFFVLLSFASICDIPHKMFQTTVKKLSSGNFEFSATFSGEQVH